LLVEIVFGTSPVPNAGITLNLFPTIEIPPNVQGSIETDMSSYVNTSLYAGKTITKAVALETTVSSTSTNTITVGSATGAEIGKHIAVVHTPGNPDGFDTYQIIGIAGNVLTVDRVVDQAYSGGTRVTRLFVEDQYIYNDAYGGARITLENLSTAGGGDASVRIRLALDEGDEQV